MKTRQFFRFFLSWYFPILGATYFLHLIFQSEHINDPLNLITPALATIVLYLYHTTQIKQK